MNALGPERDAADSKVISVLRDDGTLDEERDPKLALEEAVELYRQLT